MNNSSTRSIKMFDADKCKTKVAGKAEYRVAVGQKMSLPAKSELVTIIKNNIDVIEKGFVFLEESMSVESSTPIDILARDGNNRMVIIDIFDGNKLDWLIHAIHHYHWINENRYFFSRIFFPPQIDYKKDIRVISIIDKVLPPIRNTLKVLEKIDLELYHICCLSLGEGPCILLERDSENQSVENIVARDTVVMSDPENKFEPVGLTEEEIAQFANEISDDDEPTKIEMLDNYVQETFDGPYFRIS